MKEKKACETIRRFQVLNIIGAKRFLLFWENKILRLLETTFNRPGDQTFRDFKQVAYNRFSGGC